MLILWIVLNIFIWYVFILYRKYIFNSLKYVIFYFIILNDPSNRYMTLNHALKLWPLLMVP